MNIDAVFEEGRLHAVSGGSRFPSPYKDNIEMHNSWKEGFSKGKKESFENMSDNDKSKHWEECWRRSELEKHIILQSLFPFSRIVEDSENGFSISEIKPDVLMKYCYKAHQILLNYQSADIEEIREYDEHKCRRELGDEFADAFYGKKE